MDPLIIYGWSENNSDTRICDEWLDNNEIEMYARGIDNGLMDEAVYGLACPIKLDGMPMLSLEERSTVIIAYDTYKLTHPNAAPLGFYLGIDGEYNSDQCVYDPSLFIENKEVQWADESVKY